jgi:hypothetical protein
MKVFGAVKTGGAGDVTAHRRGFLVRVGTTSAVAALAAGVMLLPGMPAYAADDLRLQDIGTVNLGVGGGSQTLTIRIKNEGDSASSGADLTVTVPLAEQQVKIGASGACRANGNIVTCQVPTLASKATQAFTIPLTPPATSGLQPGQEANGKGTAVLSTGDQHDFTVTLRGPNQAQTVTEVSGTTVDITTGDGVPGVHVLLKDSAGHEYSATTSNSGGYRFAGTADKPISPGQLSLTATKEGFETVTVNKDGVAGRGVTGAKISLKATAASTAPSAPAASDPAPVSSEQVASGAPQPSNTSSSSGPGTLAWLIIGLGIALLLLGGGAIAFMLIKRKGDQDEPDDDYPGGAPTRVGAGAVAGAHGAYHGGPAATKVSRNGMTGMTGMNDDTAIVPPDQLDEFPDPYAAPMPSGGYGGGDQHGQGRGDRYSDQRGYGGAGGYGDGRYGADEPTGRFTPSGDGYPAAGGYPNAGQDRDEYRRPAGRAPEPPDTRYGYDQPRAGDYGGEHRTSPYDAAPGRGTPPPHGRRSVDWLDD